MNNLETVREIYSAFVQSDAPAILQHLFPSMEWEYSGTTKSVRWLQRKAGKEAVAVFFPSLSALRIDRFAPKDFLVRDNVVVVLLDLDFTVKQTGRRVVEEGEIQEWRFDAEGRVSPFRHGVDSHGHQLAIQD